MARSEQKRHYARLNAAWAARHSPPIYSSPLPSQSTDHSDVLPCSRPAARKARAGSTITSNPLRPHVPAGDRIFAWDTPYARRHRASLSMPLRLAKATLATVLAGLAHSTRSTYGAGILRFTQFCDLEGVSEEARMPASYSLLCAFLSSMVGKVSDASMRSYLAGVRAWHVFHHAPWVGEDPWVGLARSAVAKAGVHLRKKPRAPVSLEHLIALRNVIDISLPFHAAVWAAAVVTFFACRRLGETVVAGKFSPLHNVTRGKANVRFRTFRGDVKSVAFDIPWTKTTKQNGATVIATERIDELARSHGLCPVQALRNHLRVNDDSSIPDSAPLFAYKHGSSWKQLTRTDLLAFTKPVWEAAALQYVSGHSFRIGGAVALLLAGVPPEIVASTGGWTSLAFLIYWRRVEEILPLSTSKAYKQSQLQQLAESFEGFRVRNNLPSYLSPIDP